MAKNINNIFTEGLSGTVGKLMTLTQKAGATIVGKKRGASDTPPTELQLAIQERFREATMYAKMAIKNPVLKALYASVAKPAQSAYNVAVKDAFTLPEIGEVNTTGYNGGAGNVILIRADEFKIETMRVVITNAAGQLIELGNAVLRSHDPSPKMGWKYTCIADNNVIPGTKITITVIDRPGREVVKVVVL